MSQHSKILWSLFVLIVSMLSIAAQDDSGIVITPDNIDQIEQLAMYGRGRVNALVYSPDGSVIAVATTVGLSV